MSAPSGYTALDFVGFTDKGTYNTSSTYMRNDLVHYGGNIMRCLVDNTTNVTPVAGANWELWVGASANLTERTIAPLENNPADVAYGVGRQIIYDDWLWEVIAPIAVGDALIDYAVDPTNANIKKSAPVETQLLAVKAEADATDNMIAPTEASASSSSAAYSVGDQLILNNILYNVIAAIQIGDALTTGTGGNIAEADTLTDQLKEVDSQIQTLTNNDDAMLNVLGAKNLLPNNATSQAKNGVTMTVNSDGTITLSGTASEDTFFDVTRNLNFGSDSILTGAPNDRIRLAAYDGTSYFQDLGSGVAIHKGAYQFVNIIITGNTDTTGATLYPMIRPATVENDTYVPYAKTNKELTDGRLRYVDYTIPSNTYNANTHATVQGSKSNVFGLPNAAKIVSVTLMDNNYNVIVVGWNDFPESLYFRIFLYNRTTSAITAAIPVRIFYEL